MKIKLLITLFISFWACASGFANDDVKKDINRVKKSKDYIYAEITSSTLEEAKEMAETLLLDEINEWVATQRSLRNSPNLVINNQKEIWSNYSMRRGSNMYRYFLYVKKKDIIPSENAVILTKEELPTETSQLDNEEAKPRPEYPEAVETLAACTEYADMVVKMKALKAQGKVKHYARYASLENPDNFYLVIYNKAGRVVTVLTPGTERTNVKTNKKDGVSNYKGCGAIGFNL